MTRIRLPYIHEFRGRHGEIRRYFRRFGRRIPLPGPVGSEAFMTAYQAAMAHQPAGENRTGTVNAALVAYYTSLEFRSQAAGTQALRRAIYERFRVEHGDKSIGTMPTKFIAGTLSKMQPHAARNWLKALRALAQFCVAQEIITADPTQGIKLPRVKSDGHHTWTEGEIEQFGATHPVGSKARLALALLLYTCQRVSDVVLMGRQHVANGTIQVRQQKTRTPLRIPVHRALQVVLDATPSAHLTFMVNKSGSKPYSSSGFADQFRAWCDEAGLPQRCVPHGLRKAACRRLAEAGCSASEIASISGHKTLKEVERYVKEADQEHMARRAMARISGTDEARDSGNPDQTTVAAPLKSLREIS
jgi:integrase